MLSISANRINLGNHPVQEEDEIHCMHLAVLIARPSESLSEIVSHLRVGQSEQGEDATDDRQPRTVLERCIWEQRMEKRPKYISCCDAPDDGARHLVQMPCAEEGSGPNQTRSATIS